MVIASRNSTYFYLTNNKQLRSDIKIGDHCAVVMRANRKGFIVTGGNNDYKEWYTSHYYFQCDSLNLPYVLQDLPYPV